MFFVIWGQRGLVMVTVGIVGLGMIGGSLAKAYQVSGQARVLGFDTDTSVMTLAQKSGVLDGVLTRDTVRHCDLILFAIPPRAVIRFIREHAREFSSHSILIDCAAIKRVVCDAVFPLADEYGFAFLGGHPLVESEYTGFQYSSSELFVGAPMILVPPAEECSLPERARAMLTPVGFGRISVTTAAAHDRMIAYTSQLTHMVSNAYIQSPSAGAHRGFSADSYRDMTQGARLNADLWTEIFLDNRDDLLTELDTLICCLREYRRSIAYGDIDALRCRLQYGTHRKEEIDGV